MKKRVLFVCVHNAGRSQMAAAFLETFAQEFVEVYSAGSQPKDKINLIAVDAMKEVGIDISNRQPKLLNDEIVQKSDYVISMGCGDACPIYPGKTYLDWELADPAGKSLAEVRKIRDEIEERVLDLVKDIKGL